MIRNTNCMGVRERLTRQCLATLNRRRDMARQSIRQSPAHTISGTASVNNAARTCITTTSVALRLQLCQPAEGGFLLFPETPFPLPVAVEELGQAAFGSTGYHYFSFQWNSELAEQ